MTIFFVWLLLAAFGFLLSAPLFKNTPDKGLGFAPWIGLFSIAYPSWLLGHTGLFKLSTISTWSIFIVISAVIVVFFRKHKLKFDSYKIEYKYVLYHSGIWLFLYALYVWFYRHNPAIEDIEKIPDMAILMSAYRAEQLPPLNPFASGQVINYYYFGFYKTAVMAHLSGTEPYEIFNPMKAIVFATASTSLASATMLILDRMLSIENKSLQTGLMFLGGALSFIMAFMIGNFHTMYHQYILNETNFWYPNATRYIAKTIHEFPLYSFIIGDLHAHLIALPTTGLTMALVFLYTEKMLKTNGQYLDILKSAWKYLVPLCFAYGMAYASNSWDIFTGLLLVGFLTWFLLKKESLFKLTTLINTGFLSITYVLGAVLAFLPFWILFEPISSGVGHTPAEESSPTIKLMVIWLIHGLFPLLYLCLEKKKEFVFRFVRTVCALGFGLILFMEYFYFKDIYSGHLRANTLFKIGMQVWIWFSIMSACYFIYIIGNKSNWKHHVRIALTVIFGLLLGSGAIYTKKAVSQYIEVNRHKASHADGIDFIRRTYPEDYSIIRWLQENEEKQVNVLTAAGESFSAYGIINSFTGNPTVLTWVTHNWLWHGSNTEPMKPVSRVTKRAGVQDSVSHRVTQVNNFYQANDVQKAKEFIDLFRIKYVVVSNRERTKYKMLNETLIQSIGIPVFSARGATLYKVSDHEPD